MEVLSRMGGEKLLATQHCAAVFARFLTPFRSRYSSFCSHCRLVSVGINTSHS